MKLTKDYIIEGFGIKKDSEITLQEEEYNAFSFDDNGKPIPQEEIDTKVDEMLKSFESDTAFMQTNFGDLSIKDEMKKYIMARLAKEGIYPDRKDCLEYILTVNIRNI